MTRPNTADSRDTNVKYIAAVAKILHANAEAAAEGWTEVALLVNKAPDSQKVSTYAALERGSEHFDDWLPPSAWDELGKVLAAWQFELAQQGHPKWTAMFLGGVRDGGLAWLPDYSPTFGKWRIRRRSRRDWRRPPACECPSLRALPPVSAPASGRSRL